MVQASRAALQAGATEGRPREALRAALRCLCFLQTMSPVVGAPSSLAGGAGPRRQPPPPASSPAPGPAREWDAETNWLGWASLSE